MQESTERDSLQTGNINRQAFGVRLPVPLDRRGILAGNAMGSSC